MIHSAQSGYVKGRSAVINIRKTLVTLEQAKLNPTNDMIILSLDAEKAFDVYLEWLFQVLERMGFTGRFMQIIRAMYANPVARILTPGQTSETYNNTEGHEARLPTITTSFQSIDRTIDKTDTPDEGHNWNYDKRRRTKTSHIRRRCPIIPHKSPRQPKEINANP